MTYNIFEVFFTAEFCLECWNKLNKTNDPESMYIISDELDLCEGCGEFKYVVIAIKNNDFLSELGDALDALKPIIVFLGNVIVLPMHIYRYIKKRFR